jgi:hypothetical protein
VTTSADAGRTEDGCGAVTWQATVLDLALDEKTGSWAMVASRIGAAAKHARFTVDATPVASTREARRMKRPPMRHDGTVVCHHDRLLHFDLVALLF